MQDGLMTSAKARMVSPIQLAFVGDAVCSLYVRGYLVGHTNLTGRKLHLRSVSMVNASAQADAYYHVEAMLTQEEKDIARRGRGANTKPPKNADAAAYRAATGYEALLGYLYISGQNERLDSILENSMRYWEEEYAKNKA